MYGAPSDSTSTPPPPPPPPPSTQLTAHRTSSPTRPESQQTYAVSAPNTARRSSQSTNTPTANNMRTQTRPPPFDHFFPNETFSEVPLAPAPYDPTALAAAIFDEINMSGQRRTPPAFLPSPLSNDRPYLGYQYGDGLFHNPLFQSRLPAFDIPNANLRAAQQQLFSGFQAANFSPMNQTMPSQYSSAMMPTPLMPNPKPFIDVTTSSQWARIMPTRVATAPTVSTPSSTTSSSSSSSPLRSVHVASHAMSLVGQYQTVIDCGYLDESGDRQLLIFSTYFNKQIEVYTASNDPSRAFLYRVSALAEKIGCATNKVGMYLARRRKVNFGIFQATQFRNKPAGRTGLKAGGYFLTQEACEQFEHHFKTKLSTNVAVRRSKRRSGSDDNASSSASDSDDESHDNDEESSKKNADGEWATKSPRNVKRKSQENSVATTEERDTKRVDSLLSTESSTSASSNRQARSLTDESSPTVVTIRGHSASYAALVEPRYDSTTAVNVTGPHRIEQAYVAQPLTQFASPAAAQQQYQFEGASDLSPPQFAEQLMTRRLQQYPYATQTPVVSHEHLSQYAFAEVQMSQSQMKGESPELLPLPHYIPPFEGRIPNAPSPYDEATNITPQPQWKHNDSSQEQ